MRSISRGRRTKSIEPGAGSVNRRATVTARAVAGRGSEAAPAGPTSAAVRNAKGHGRAAIAETSAGPRSRAVVEAAVAAAEVAVRAAGVRIPHPLIHCR